MANRFFVGDVDADWNDANNWASTSGGAGGAGIPGSGDTAIFDGYSPDCTIDSPPASITALDLQSSYSNTLNTNGFGIVCSAGITVSGGTIQDSGAATWQCVDFLMNGGTVTMPALGGKIEASGDFTLSSGTFTHNSGTVDLNGSGTQAINIGAYTLYHLTLNNTSTLTFTGTIDVDGNLTVTAALNVNGGTIELAGNLVSTDTSMAGTTNLTFNGTGAQNITMGGSFFDGDITINKASGTVTLLSDFTPAWTGDFIMSAGTFDCDVYNMTCGTSSAGDFYLNGGTFLAPGTGKTLDINGFYLNGGTFTHNSGAIIKRRRNWEIDIAFTCYDFTVNTGGANITMDSFLGSFVNTNKYTIEVVHGFYGTYTIECQKDFEFVDTTVFYGAGVFTLKFNGTGAQLWESSSGAGPEEAIIDKASGTLTFGAITASNGNIEYIKGTVDLTTNDNTHYFRQGGSAMKTSGFAFNHAWFQNAGNMVLAEDMFIDGNTTFVASNTLQGTPNIIHVRGNFETRKTTVVSSPNTGWVFDGTGDQEITSDAPTSLRHMGGTFKIDKASGTLTIKCYLQNQVTFQYVKGTMAHDANSKYRVTTSMTITGTCEMNDVEISHGSTMTTSGILKALGDLDILAAVTMNGGTLEFEGDFSSTDAAMTGTTAIKAVGTGAQNINVGTNDLPNGDFTIDKPTGEAVLTAAFTPASWTGDLIINQGILSTGGFNITASDLIVNANGVFKWKGNETLTISGATTLTGTVEYYDAAVEVTIDDFATTFAGLTLGAGKTHKVTAGVGNGITVTGSFGTRGTSVNRAVLRSTSEGTQWELDLQGTSAIGDGVDVKDSDASAGNVVSALNSEDSGNNDNWFFGIGQGGFGLFRPNSFRYNRGICPKQLG